MATRDTFKVTSTSSEATGASSTDSSATMRQGEAATILVTVLDLATSHPYTRPWGPCLSRSLSSDPLHLAETGSLASVLYFGSIPMRRGPWATSAGLDPSPTLLLDMVEAHDLCSITMPRADVPGLRAA